MKNKWYKCVFVLFASLFIFPLNSHAECDYKRMAELNRIASNVQINYSYDVGTDNIPIFNVYITNITPDIYAEMVDGRQIGENSTVEVFGGESILLTFYSKDISCFGEKLLTKNIKIPQYNFLADSVDCLKYPDFKYCKVWASTDAVSNDEFYNELNKYINKQKNTKSVNDKNIKLIFGKETIIYLSIIIFIIIFLFIFLKKKRGKNK